MHDVFLSPRKPQTDMPARLAWVVHIRRCRQWFARLRHDWLRILGAPDYQAYLAHHAVHHADRSPMSEREYVAFFIERRYNRRGAGRCC